LPIAAEACSPAVFKAHVRGVGRWPPIPATTSAMYIPLPSGFPNGQQSLCSGKSFPAVLCFLRVCGMDLLIA
jgi:hypothetical protein